MQSENLIDTITINSQALLIMKNRSYLFAGILLISLPAVSYQPPDAVTSGVLDEGIRADSLAYISKNTTNSRSFVVHVLEAGLYFCNFWMQPYISSDGVSHVYEVYVNGERAGSISPKKSGWQSLCVDGIPRLQFKEGDNTITITEDGINIPDIEKVCVGKTNDEAQIDSSAYENYLIRARTVEDPVHETEESNMLLYALNDRSMVLVDKVVPLRYSFYKVLSLNKGQQLNICTSCQLPCSADLFYIGKQYSLRSQSLTDQDNAQQTNLSYIDDFKIKYEMSSPAEMQGLTWKRTRTLGEIPFEFTVDIPQSGYYMLKLRSKYNDALCTAIIDLSVKGTDSEEWKSIGHYVDAILSYSYEDCVVPANASDYVVMTKGERANGYDPMLFVEGNAGGRIVGYSDDASSSTVEEFGLSSKDAFLEQVYKIKTSGIHVSNYSSLYPETTCRLICGLRTEVLQDLPIVSKVLKSKVYTNIEEQEFNSDGNISGCKQLVVYDASGKQVLSTTDTETASVRSRLKKGMYIVKAILDNGRFNIYKLNIK